ncbi:MAG: hypothetical protein MUC79_11000 [Thiobacillaceae bacterium]|jgi:hypothetical protein|nr:hypothetical protein [Thiobacillaceae bacterium]
MGLMERLRRSGTAWARTIVAFQPPGLPRGGHAGEPSGQMVTQIERTPEDEFKIRLAYNDERNREASFLVKKRYADAGYVSKEGRTQHGCPEQITLLSYHKERVVGTLTVGMDVGQGLHADELYREEIDRLRASGHKVAEFTKLAIDTNLASKQVLASMFHIAYIHLRRIWRYTDMVIEVNPSHVAFYKRMFGFQELGPQRLCPRVNAPALLLWLESDHVDRMIAEYGGKPQLAKQARSIYPYLFSPNKDQEITKRLIKSEREG